MRCATACSNSCLFPFSPAAPVAPLRYPVHACWAADRPTADFKVLAAAQHPETLGNPAAWAVALPEAEITVDTLDLAAVATMLARGELSLAEPWLLAWKDLDGASGAEDDHAGGTAAPQVHLGSQPGSRVRLS